MSTAAAKPHSHLPRPVPGWLRTTAWFGVLLWTVAICILSSLTPAQLDHLSEFKLWDKAEHFIAFAVGAGNLALVLRWSRPWPTLRVAFVSIAAISCFGAIDEFHQLYTPGRSGADPFDWMADTLGAAAGATLTLLIYARFSRPRRLTPATA